MSRRTARKHAFVLVYQSGFHELEYYNEMILDYLSEIDDADNGDMGFIRSEFNGVLDNRPYLDGIIESYSEGWTLERLSKVDLSILRLCVYEMLKVEDIPESVAINEAVELAKTFGGDNSPTFINGILSSVSKDREKLL